MDRTPSPSRRVRTPPAPLHGPKYDNYEPFSPRRSSRVAAQHNNTHLHPHPHPHPHPQPDPTASPTSKRSVRDLTPTSSRPSVMTRTAHFALSPPSSPVSPAKTRSPRSTRRTQHGIAAPDSDSGSDSGSLAPSSARRLFPAMASNGMLPTPAKTPRKRTLHTANSLGRTARVLFEDRPATVEDVMPTPRKAHKTTKSALDLESLDGQISTATPKIGVYVDSKERVPDREDEENNPFITRRGRGKAKAVTEKSRKMDEKSQKMFEAAARDEGMVYTHRGKRIFRPFDDIPRSDEADGGRSSGDELHRKADRTGNRRITRSAIQPKLLFKEEIERLKRENGDLEDDDEEALTDIEIHIATPSRKMRHVEASASFPQESTPAVPKVKRQTSFESWSGSWRRVKSASHASSSPRAGTKRRGEPLEQPADKRARSEHSSASTLASA